MAKVQKLTDWFPAEVKPARDGVYLTRKPGLTHEGVYRKYEGGRWFFNAELDLMRAAAMTELATAMGREWRGLAEQPK